MALDPATLSFLPYQAAQQAAPPMELLQFAGGVSPQFTGQAAVPQVAPQAGGMDALMKMLMMAGGGGQAPGGLGTPQQPHFPGNPYIGATGARPSLQPTVAMPQPQNPNLQTLMQLLGGRR